MMRQIVRAWKKSPDLRDLALSHVRGFDQKDWYSEIAAIHALVRDKIRYVRDINGVETLHTPDQILKRGQGDCDDKSILLAALLESIGHPTRFVAVDINGRGFSHVYVETKIGNKWVGLETTEPWDLGRVVPSVERMVLHN
jgi:transglutaminase-like putative cysteine protease